MAAQFAILCLCDAYLNILRVREVGLGCSGFIWCLHNSMFYHPLSSEKTLQDQNSFFTLFRICVMRTYMFSYTRNCIYQISIARCNINIFRYTCSPPFYYSAQFIIREYSEYFCLNNGWIIELSPIAQIIPTI